MCSFANGKADKGFVHPVVRAILIHFWLAYDHPFVDGNGRTARALFYWCMLHNGYWLFEFIPISRVIKQARAQYARAFLHAEDDENDATYFIMHQLGVITRALDDLRAYLTRKMAEQRQFAQVMMSREDLNSRQRALLAHALRYGRSEYTISGHQRSHQVAYQTARTDMLDLVDRKFLEQRKSGRKFVFVPVKDLGSKLQHTKIPTAK
jgi:Fic family protein